MNYAAYIKSAVPCRMLMDSVGIAVNGSGFAQCPFHPDRHASMKVYSGDRGWHCYVCNTGGSVIDFVMALYGLDFKQACAKLNDDFHLGLELDKPSTSEQRKQAELNRTARQIVKELREMRLEAAEMAFWAAFDDWMENDRIIAEEAPGGPLEPFTDRFASALARRDEVQYRLDIAEYELDKARHAK